MSEQCTEEASANDDALSVLTPHGFQTLQGRMSDVPTKVDRGVDHGDQDLGAQGGQQTTNPQSNQVPAPGYQGVSPPVKPTVQAPQNSGGPGHGSQQSPAASQPAQGGH